jgi:hypothetical protein
MEYQNLYQDGPPAPPPPPPAARKAGGRARRVAASTAAATVLLGGGAAIGIALTGGASAATTSNSGAANSGASSSGVAGGRCHRLTEQALSSGHPVVARRLHALCASPLRRLAIVGGIHGQVTFRAKSGTRTIAFERGTVQSVAGSVVTVQAPDGTRWTWDIVSNTVIRQSGHQVTKSQLAVGDQVLIAGQVLSGTNDARLIRIRPAG